MTIFKVKSFLAIAFTIFASSSFAKSSYDPGTNANSEKFPGSTCQSRSFWVSGQIKPGVKYPQPKEWGPKPAEPPCGSPNTSLEVDEPIQSAEGTPDTSDGGSNEGTPAGA